MRIVLSFSLFCWIIVSTFGMGLTEDPQEKQTKTWELSAVRTLEIRGQIDFELVPGPTPKVTVETTRALFDQLTVSNWWGAATVAIESGLRGPRERGAVKVTITLPSLVELNVSDRSTGRGVWPGAWGTLRIQDHSAVELVLEGSNFSLETSWLTRVSLEGKIERLRIDERHQSRVDTTSLSVASAEVSLDEESTLEAGPTLAGKGEARHLSRLTVEALEPWEPFVLKEDSVRELRTEKTTP